MIGRTNSTFGGAISLPDGSTVTPVNDVQTWLKCAGIKDKTYTTVSQVVADTNTMFLLTSDENAMKYLARSTDFADTICADETSMTYLGQSAYVDSTVLNSDLWVTAISSSNYYELIYDPITVHSSASATISFNGKSFTSDASGNTTKVIPWGTFTFSDSVSGQSYERTIDRNTTELYVMPEGSLYWYGNECTDVTGGWLTPDILTDEDYKFDCKKSGCTNLKEKNTNYLRLEVASTAHNGSIASYYTANAIIINNKKLNMKYSGDAVEGAANIGCYTSKPINIMVNTYYKVANLYDSNVTNHTLSTESINETLYVNVFAKAYSNVVESSKMKVHAVWLE